MESVGREILNQLAESNFVPEEKCKPNQKVLHFSKTCPACSGTGNWREKIVKTTTKTIKCKRCVDGYVPVPCNNCFNGWSETGPCKTCKGSGIYVYYPTEKFPEGKTCRFCRGTGEIIKQNVYTLPIVKCLKCKGTGNINKSFNPIFKEEDVALLESVDLFAEVLFKPITEEEQTVSQQ